MNFGHVNAVNILDFFFSELTDMLPIFKGFFFFFQSLKNLKTNEQKETSFSIYYAV